MANIFSPRREVAWRQHWRPCCCPPLPQQSIASLHYRQLSWLKPHSATWNTKSKTKIVSKEGGGTRWLKQGGMNDVNFTETEEAWYLPILLVARCFRENPLSTNHPGLRACFTSSFVSLDVISRKTSLNNSRSPRTAACMIGVRPRCAVFFSTRTAVTAPILVNTSLIAPGTPVLMASITANANKGENGKKIEN